MIAMLTAVRFLSIGFNIFIFFELKGRLDGLSKIKYFRISILTGDQHQRPTGEEDHERVHKTCIIQYTSATRMTDFAASLKSRVTALAENARDLTLDFEVSSGSRFFDNDEQTIKEVQALLNSRLEREKLEALRRLVAV